MGRFFVPTILCAVFLCPAALADFAHPGPSEVAVRDMPDTDGQWQEARAIIDAPPEAVRRWLGELEYWPARFRDVQAIRVLSRNGRSTRVAMRSRILGREMVLEVWRTPRGFFYKSHDHHVQALGRTYVTATPDGRTDVIMQATADVSGLVGILAPGSMIRDREREKLTADLNDLHRLARLRGNGEPSGEAATVDAPAPPATAPTPADGGPDAGEDAGDLAPQPAPGGAPTGD